MEHWLKGKETLWQYEKDFTYNINKLPLQIYFYFTVLSKVWEEKVVVNKAKEAVRTCHNMCFEKRTLFHDVL